MQAKDYADPSEEVIIGHVGDEYKNTEDENRTAGIGPHEYVAYLLDSVDDCVYHPKH